MYYQIEGGDLNDFKLIKLNEVIQFGCNYLKLYDLDIEELTIHIGMPEDYSHPDGEPQGLADADFYDNEPSIYVSSKLMDFQHDINPRVTVWSVFAEMAKTVFHEMVHIEQIMSGRLARTGTDHARWNGEEVKDVGHKDVGYYDLPWEEEAFKFEKIIYEEFAQLVKSVAKRVYINDT